MLSELRETNQQLREKLQGLRKETSRLSGESELCLNASSVMDTSLTSSSGGSSTRQNSISDHGGVPAPCSGRVSPCRFLMLSDRAKHIRGEASKRIDGLLTDWRDYKEKADEEIRRRHRTEQHLREMLARKDRESAEMARELSSLRIVADEQKSMVDQLTSELETDEKCRAKCVALELEVSKLNRSMAQLTEEVRARDQLIRTSEAERDSLASLNAELRERNREQKSKIESCERDVNETRMELEILEEMVRALNERKTNIFTHSAANSVRSVTPTTPVDVSFLSRQNVLQTAANKSISSSAPYSTMREEIIPTSYNTSGSPHSVEMPPPNRQSTLVKEGSDRELADRRSAMSALKSLQKEHTEKCDFLADHIRKLKEENQAKEKTISDLQTSTSKKLSL